MRCILCGVAVSAVSAGRMLKLTTMGAGCAGESVVPHEQNVEIGDFMVDQPSFGDCARPVILLQEPSLDGESFPSRPCVSNALQFQASAI